MLERITPLILTFNEAANIGRVLERLTWARRIVVLDSGSSDETLAIASAFANVVVIHRPFDSHAAQWNHGLAADAIETEWVLALDSDYLLPAALVEELATLAPSNNVAGFRASFRYCVDGRRLRGSLYPPVTVLFRRAGARFAQEGHTQRVQLSGELGSLKTPIDHDDRKPLSQWLAAQDRYARLEADLLESMPSSALRPQDRLRRALVVTPWLVPLYVLFVRGCMLDGMAGWHYALQRGIAEAVLSLKLLELRWSDSRMESGKS